MKGRFPSNYPLNTCLQDNLSNRRHYVAIHEVITYRQDAVGALHKYVFPFSQNEYSLTAMSAGELRKSLRVFSCSHRMNKERRNLFKVYRGHPNRKQLI